MTQTVTPVHLLQKIVHLRHSHKKTNQNKKQKKQSVQKQIMWDPCCQHGSVKEKNTVLSPLFPKIKVRENERNIENRFKPLKRVFIFIFEEPLVPSNANHEYLS